MSVNIYVQKRALFEIPNNINIVGVDADNDSPLETLIHFYPPFPVDEKRVVFYVVSKPVSDENIITNIIPVGGIIMRNLDETVLLGHFKLYNNGKTYGYLTLERIGEDKWKISSKEPEAYLYKTHIYGLSLTDCETNNLKVEMKNVLYHLLICKEEYDVFTRNTTAVLYLLLPTDKIGEVLLKKENKIRKFRFLWNNGEPYDIEVSDLLEESERFLIGTDLLPTLKNEGSDSR